ncbi:MAG: 5'-methylthioadenosine/adenosylhomocysteine nucleosidase [Oscillospiraceae bacterium]|nr:5'-methylthioadenosine/adenosylhomocysteine nucleosidase [Oscillospiraceae bacterium]MDD6084766.1 5'-methylthioadenosine/adenosylhomocysteine nucleosidase [Oscillospiraceae bacterium]MDY3256930.1 5'-methylthioadenosine/adenosylhomocysteine nucleosidase [Ruminococcus callidus]
MKTIGIIGAMPSELADIIKALPAKEKKEISRFTYHIYEKDDKRIVYACSGIAKVNSALCTQVMIDNFKPCAIINTGIAGGMNKDVKVCDIVISDLVMPHDLDPHFLKDYPPYCCEFPSDKALIELAESVCKNQGVKSFVGRIVSGEQFVTDTVAKNAIKDKFEPMAVDMETAAIAHCAYMNKMPFVSVRCISDNADDEGAMSFDIFEKKAAGIVANIVLEMADKI